MHTTPRATFLENPPFSRSESSKNPAFRWVSGGLLHHYDWLILIDAYLGPNFGSLYPKFSLLHSIQIPIFNGQHRVFVLKSAFLGGILQNCPKLSKMTTSFPNPQKFPRFSYVFPRSSRVFHGLPQCFPPWCNFWTLPAAGPSHRTRSPEHPEGDAQRPQPRWIMESY